jgi:hypothetical protein
MLLEICGLSSFNKGAHTLDRACRHENGTFAASLHVFT